MKLFYFMNIKNKLIYRYDYMKGLENLDNIQ